VRQRASSPPVVPDLCLLSGCAFILLSGVWVLTCPPFFLRVAAGIDVHRKVHVRAMRELAYMSQWRAYCERCDPLYIPVSTFSPTTSTIHPR